QSFDKLNGEFNPQQLSERKVPLRMVNQKAGRPVCCLLHRLFHRSLFFLTGRVRTSFVPWKMIKTWLSEVRRHRIAKCLLVWHFGNAEFAKGQQIVGDETPNKHDDAAKNACEKDASTHG